jgi:hypothetical protein
VSLQFVNANISVNEFAVCVSGDTDNWQMVMQRKLIGMGYRLFCCIN